MHKGTKTRGKWNIRDTECRIRMGNIIAVKILKDRKKMEQKQFEDMLDTIIVKLMKVKIIFPEAYERKSEENSHLVTSITTENYKQSRNLKVIRRLSTLEGLYSNMWRLNQNLISSLQLQWKIADSWIMFSKC